MPGCMSTDEDSHRCASLHRAHRTAARLIYIYIYIYILEARARNLSIYDLRMTAQIITAVGSELLNFGSSRELEPGFRA